MFAEWLESMRKDIECTFGILKQRFRILKKPIRLYFEDDIDDVVRTCAVLHNILLEFDSFLNPHWADIDPNVEEPEEDPQATQSVSQDPEATQDVSNVPLFEGVYQATQFEPDDHKISWNQDLFSELRAALVKHLAYQYRMHRVEWPKNFTVSEKRAWTPDIVMSRTERRYQDSLSHVVYIRDSVLRRRDITGEFTMGIGLGLFAKVSFQAGEKIAFFVGEIFTDLNEFDTDRVGHKPYILQSKQANAYGVGEWLDCFESRLRNNYYVSVANSPYACLNSKTNKMAEANCSLKVSHHASGPKFSLEVLAKKTIKEHDEILWSYGANYAYPPEYPTYISILMNFEYTNLT
jgi:hypothetical protein